MNFEFNLLLTAGSGDRCRVEDAHVVVESVLVAVRLLGSACHIQDHVEDLLADCVGSQPILTQVEWGKLKVQLPSNYATLLRLV